MDFSENAEMIHQDEVQSAHWTHGQVTIFTAVVWTASFTQSYAVLSDHLVHDKHATAVFLRAILDDINAKASTSFTSLEIWSDGAAQHFKQRYMFAFISSLVDQYTCGISWEFFATSHGKGAVDGVGGTIKRKVFMAVKARVCVITTPQQYYDVAKHKVPTITMIWVSAIDIDGTRDALDKLWGPT